MERTNKQYDDLQLKYGSQDDARPLPDDVFLHYKELLMQELKLINPDKIIFFGNQVASISLGGINNSI